MNNSLKGGECQLLDTSRLDDFALPFTVESAQPLHEVHRGARKMNRFPVNPFGVLRYAVQALTAHR